MNPYKPNVYKTSLMRSPPPPPHALKSQSNLGNITRNWTTTLPTIIVMAITLTMFHSSFLFIRKRRKCSKSPTKYSITVYLKDDADPFEVGNVITELEQREDVVKPVSYTSKEQAWKLISKTFSLDTALLEKYKFSLPATLTITPRQLEDTGNIKIFLNENAKNLLKSLSDPRTKQKCFGSND